LAQISGFLIDPTREITMIQCAYCTTDNPPEANKCSNCGAALVSLNPATPVEMLLEDKPMASTKPKKVLPTDENLAEKLPDPLTPSYSTALDEPVQPAPVVSRQDYPAPTTASKPHKDRGLALVIEILPGLFGFLGLGWIYSGNLTVGLIWLVGFFIWTVTATILSVVTAGIGIFCWLPISLTCIIISAVTLHRYTKNHPERFGS
jgi:hypothetical protein